MRRAIIKAGKFALVVGIGLATLAPTAHAKHHHHHGGHIVVFGGVGFGAPFYRPYRPFAYPFYYSPPVYYAPPVYYPPPSYYAAPSYGPPYYCPYP